MARATTIERGLPLSWENAIRVALGELNADEAIEQDLEERLPTINANTLVGLPTLARILKIALQNVYALSEADENFPTPVAHLSRHTAWLYSDIKLYRRGLQVPKRKLDERQRADDHGPFRNSCRAGNERGQRSTLDQG